MPSGPKKNVRTRERRTLLVEAIMTVGGGYWLMAPLLNVPDDGDHEAVVAFAAYGLDRRGVEARFSGDNLVHPAHALDGRVGIGRVKDLSIAHDVVSDDEGAGAGQLQGPLDVAGIIALICVDENEIE